MVLENIHSSINLMRTISFLGTVGLSNNTVNIEYDDTIHITITRDITNQEMKHFIRTTSKLYNKAKIPGNIMFIVLRIDDSLDIIVTDSKLQNPSCVKI